MDNTLLFDNDFVKRLNNMKIAMKTKSNTNLMGGRKSNAKGSSVEFSDYREYALGDDLRRVDWNAYGRFDKVYIKLFSEEREGIFNIFLDTSESMNYGEKPKKNMALYVAAGIIYIVLNSLDRAALHLIKDGELNIAKGKTGRANYYKMLQDLEQIEFSKSAGLTKAILQYPFKYKGVSVIISDFYEIDDLEDALKYLKFKKQEIILVRILSKEEIEPELTGALNFIDCENDKNSYKVDVDSTLISDYHKAYKSFNEKLSALALKYQANLIMVSSEDSFEKVLMRL
ncbi:MAG: DUF58 domain-containing protein [Lachnospiraceae bacterium]|nr:DUF58 domain-containing protein [Lachnospiraceae bacterium]